MSDLDDFNRRMTAGSSSWMQGPPTHAAESAAQSLIDAQSHSTSVGGGSIDFGVRISAIIVLIGIALFVVGTYLADHFREAKAMTGLLIVLIGSFALILGSGGLVMGCIKGLGSVSGWRSLAFAILAAFAAWWLSPWLWMMSGALVPKSFIPLAAVALVFVVSGQ